MTRMTSWEKSHWIETKYRRQLRAIAQEVGRIVSSYSTTTVQGRLQMQDALDKYSDMLEPWAEIAASNVFNKLNNQDLTLWMRQSQAIGAGVKELINNTHIGSVMQDFIKRQVELITSLPVEAGFRVHDLARNALQTGQRPESIISEIMRSGEVTVSRAKLIARTECARASSVLTQTRALNIGATHAIWRTSKDESVRSSHKHMEGKVYSLTEPPELEDGTRTFPGQIYQCRCHGEIIIPGV